MTSTLQNTYPRLERLEAALHGVDNLAGRVVAMDTMASDLAVPIPTLNTTPAVCASIPEGAPVMHTSVPVAGAFSSSSTAHGSTGERGQNSLNTFAPSGALGLGSDAQGSSHNLVSRTSDMDSGSPTALLDTAASFVNASQSPETAVAADAARKSLASGQAPRTIKALHEGMHELRQDTEALRMCANSLRLPMEPHCWVLDRTFRTLGVV